ncbi:hypothetical protein [Methanobrevibacter sp. UBA212]|uniref:hypothetical protein n=1 Tax=Methanobrevibacter sp. UBA212 TaxID=1915476 RepID=UPI0025E33ECA|nr:hypothetical protein [Methanobrevibacter sp. UBA212]
MDFKKLLLVCLMIFVFAAGAVSASNDINQDNNQTVFKTDEDLGQPDEPVLAASNEDDLKSVDDVIGVRNDGEDIVGYNESKVSCAIEGNVYLNHRDEVLLFSSSDPNATGNFSVYVDGSLKYSRFVNQSNYAESFFYIIVYVDELNIDSIGTYHIKATFNDKVLDEKSVVVEPYYFKAHAFGIGYGKPLDFYVYLPYDATGRVTLKINGKSYDFKYEDFIGPVSVDTKGWDVGEYVATVTYFGNSKYVENSINFTVLLQPYKYYTYYASVGENDYIELDVKPGLNDYAEITTYRLEGDTFIKLSNTTIKFNDGIARFYPDNFGVGFYRFNVTYHVGNNTGNTYLDRRVVKNTEGFSASVSPSKINAGSTVTVKVKGAKLPNYIEVEVDGIIKKQALMSKGKVSIPLSGLKVGTHKIKIWLEMCDDTTDDYNYESGYFFSYTAYVTVKKFNKLTLSKVKVKKSAKKLTIKATLKIDGVAYKGKVIKFKFNKKTYKAKTNKNGVAKITVKKAILKKLKVGKKVKYQATFGKKTVKRTVKVKR